MEIMYFNDSLYMLCRGFFIIILLFGAVNKLLFSISFLVLIFAVSFRRLPLCLVSSTHINFGIKELVLFQA